MLFKTSIMLICLFSQTSITSSQADKRSRILLIDSGVNKTELEKFFCETGHISFLDGKHSDPFVDATGHGTLMANTMAQYLDPSKQCIVVYKTFSGNPEPEAYATALHKAMDEEFVAISISLGDSTHYLAEADWFKKLSKNTRVFVSAGNDGTNLSLKCNEYPACLAKAVGSDNFRVVGSDSSGWNHGGPINEWAESTIVLSGKKHYGTSVSTARASAKFAASK